jgi:hypothetical protein
MRVQVGVESLSRLRGIRSWYLSDQDPERRVPILSAYLGHVHVAVERRFGVDAASDAPS